MNKGFVNGADMNGTAFGFMALLFGFISYETLGKWCLVDDCLRRALSSNETMFVLLLVMIWNSSWKVKVHPAQGSSF